MFCLVEKPLLPEVAKLSMPPALGPLLREYLKLTCQVGAALEIPGILALQAIWGVEAPVEAGLVDGDLLVAVKTLEQLEGLCLVRVVVGRVVMLAIQMPLVIRDVLELQGLPVLLVVLGMLEVPGHRLLL